jgi:cystathionine gamma-synthase
MARRAHTSTRAVHAGETRIKPHHAVTTPIIQSSTFTFTDTADLVNFMETQRRNQIGDRLEYGRYGNPTVAAVERKLADLDGGETAQLFSSGMAAVTITLLSLLSAGNHIVMTDDCYRRTREFVAEFLPRLGVQATQVPVGDYDALEDAIRPNTCVIFSESPTNPYLRVVDVQRIVAIARRHRLHTVIDSTFATPINQRPLEAGINLVIHSATKYLAGHNDLLAGAVIGSRDLIDQVRATQAMVGAICDASTAYLLLRGLKTLSLRVTRQNETGMQVARFLESDPRVRRVYYPGLPSHPQHATAREQMSGFGGVVSFELDGDLAQTTRFVDALQIPYIGPSFGGVESLVEQVVLASYYTLSPEQWAEIGISDTLVRLGVGVEEADDLIADLAQALELALGNRN